MKTYNLTHTLMQGDSDVYFKTSLPQETVEDVIALIHFTAEQVVSDSVSVYEELLVEGLKCIFPLKVKDAKMDKNAPQIDQYTLREIRCGQFYKTNWNKWLTTPQYKVIWELVSKRTELWSANGY